MTSPPDVAFSIATSLYTGHVSHAVIATAEDAFAIRPDGRPYDDQTRRLSRLARIARAAPDTPDEWFRLAGMNLSAIGLGPPHPAKSVSEAVMQAVAEMQRRTLS